MQSTEVVCQSCEWMERRTRGEAPAWDCILRTDHWDIVHSNNTSLEGWLVLVLRRHVEAVADMSDDEARELGPLLRRVSSALHHVTGCVKTYVVQFAEHPQHRHVHIHVIPRHADLADDITGPRIFELLGVDATTAVTEDRMNAIAEGVRVALLQR